MLLLHLLAVLPPVRLVRHRHLLECHVAAEAVAHRAAGSADLAEIVASRLGRVPTEAGAAATRVPSAARRRPPPRPGASYSYPFSAPLPIAATCPKARAPRLGDVSELRSMLSPSMRDDPTMGAGMSACACVPKTAASIPCSLRKLRPPNAATCVTPTLTQGAPVTQCAQPISRRVRAGGSSSSRWRSCRATRRPARYLSPWKKAQDRPSAPIFPP